MTPTRQKQNKTTTTLCLIAEEHYDYSTMQKSLWYGKSTLRMNLVKATRRQGVRPPLSWSLCLHHANSGQMNCSQSSLRFLPLHCFTYLIKWSKSVKIARIQYTHNDAIQFLNPNTSLPPVLAFHRHQLCFLLYFIYFIYVYVFAIDLFFFSLNKKKKTYMYSSSATASSASSKRF